MRVGTRGRILALIAGSVVLGTAVAPPALAQASAKLDDPTIVAIFDAANTWDMQTGRIAASKATTKEIRDFGAMLERDHTKVRQMGRDLAKQLGVTPTPPKDFAMAKDHAAAVAALNSAQGKEFDRTFLKHEVDYHKAVIAALNNTLLPAIQNEKLKNLVKQVVPAFDAHMREAQRLLDKVGN